MAVKEEGLTQRAKHDHEGKALGAAPDIEDLGRGQLDQGAEDAGEDVGKGDEGGVGEVAVDVER